MCGIAGFISKNETSENSNLLKKMTGEISHRGPDADGHFCHENIALGHRRLSILDLSPTGAQPMESASGRFVVVFNGEIYNYLDLKKEIEDDFNWRGTSDSEVFLNYIEKFGIQKALEKSCGMFAFALWDHETKKLMLARDAMGEKPLYYGKSGDCFFFGSELKSLMAHPRFQKTINLKALDGYFKYNCVPGDLCIFEGIQKLKPGTWIEVDQSQNASDPNIFWNLEQVALKGQTELFNSYDESLDALEKTLLSVVDEMMKTDVPYGAFVSSGIDSSLIVSLMQKLSNKPVSTFSIGFEDKVFDESTMATKISKHLGTNHTNMVLSGKDCLEIVPRLAKIYCEPFSDSSQIPTFLVSQLARSKVTVSLSGDAGDEMLAGYNRHEWIPKIWNKAKSVPSPLRKVGGKSLKMLSMNQWNQLLSLLGNDRRRPGDKVYQISDILQCESPREIYQYLTTHWKQNLISGFVDNDKGLWPELDLSMENKILLQDQLGYLNHDILTKVDRAAMRNSLEVRVPFLDKRVVETSWRIPFTHKLKNSVSKSPAREILFKYVPKEYYEGPKKGFAIPLEGWLRHELKDWCGDLLQRNKLEEAGLNSSPILDCLNEHWKGQQNWHYHLWDVLMYMSWREEYL